MRKFLAMILVLTMIASLAVVCSFAADDTTEAEGGDTTEAQGGDTTEAEGGDTTEAEGGDTTEAEGGDTTEAEGGDTTAAEGGDTTAAEGGDTTAAEGGDTTAAEGDTTEADAEAADGDLTEVKGDRDPLIITAGNVTVTADAKEAIVPVTISAIDPALGISSVLVTVKAVGATIKSIDQADLTGGNWVVGDLAESGTVMWADTAKGTMEPSVVFANVTVALPDGIAVGDSFEVKIIVSNDPANYISFVEVDDDTVAYGAKGVAGSITVVDAEAEETTDGATTVADSTTAPADDGKKAPQTGDVAIIVVAAMIVALGTAIVVKKVNVK